MIILRWHEHRFSWGQFLEWRRDISKDPDLNRVPFPDCISCGWLRFENYDRRYSVQSALSLETIQNTNCKEYPVHTATPQHSNTVISLLGSREYPSLNLMKNPMRSYHFDEVQLENVLETRSDVMQECKISYSLDLRKTECTPIRRSNSRYGLFTQAGIYSLFTDALLLLQL